MAIDTLFLNPKDHVATAVRQLESGQKINVTGGANNVDIFLRDTIPFGHKFAIRNIEPGEKIVKYGEVIGQATAKINEGAHVHVHNVEGLRGRGDRQ